MSLQAPNLDDWSFDRLLAEAQRRMVERCPEWDTSPSNPGTVLLEAFAYLTDVLMYRLNRLPQKAYVEFLRLLGARLHPPAAAGTTLRFTLDRSQDRAVEIPEGTRVTVNGWTRDSVPPVFQTVESVSIPAGGTEVEVQAYHYERVAAELIGTGTGMAGQSFVVRKPPVLAPLHHLISIVVGVEAAAEELADARSPAREHDGKTYRIWSEVANFAETRTDAHVFVIDRFEGRITFAPAARMTDDAGELEPTARPLTSVPQAEREIRVWYLTGGGADGNVAAGTLSALKDPIPGLSVANPRPASGGCRAESLENALVRGPQEFNLGQRAVTAADFEHLALRERGAVARARAFTKSALWHHAPPGTVEVHLVPRIPEELLSAAITSSVLADHETEEARARIRQTLDERRPMGVRCEVRWASCKAVRVRARIVIRPEEDAVAVESRIRRRLAALISPLALERGSRGWEYGEPLHVFQVYDLATREPGVRRIEDVSLIVDGAPDDALTLARDPYQANTWFAGGGENVFRTQDRGEGWEQVASFPGEEVVRLEPCTALTGVHALVTRVRAVEGSNAELSRLRITRDCGSTWTQLAELEWRVLDLAWASRGTDQVLFAAGSRGLREFGVVPPRAPNVVVVRAEQPELPLYAVSAARNARDEVHVAVAVQQLGGVWISTDAGHTGTFAKSGLENRDVRVLEVQADGDRTRFWAGTMVPGGQPGDGCFSWDFTEGKPKDNWRAWKDGWDAGGCRSLAFAGTRVYAGTVRRGVLRLDRTVGGTAWTEPSFDCGLPLRDPGRLEPVRCLAVDRDDRDVVMAGGDKGVQISFDGGRTYRSASRHEFVDKVTIPPTWLFCSGEHQLEIVTDHEGA